MKYLNTMHNSSASDKRRLSHLVLGSAFLSSLMLAGVVSAEYQVGTNAMSFDREQMWYGGTAGKQNIQDIVDTAVDAGSFSTLLIAVQEAGLVDTLKGKGPYTVFAPTDEAFSKIPAVQLQALPADKEALISVLTYRVVPGNVLAEDVVTLNTATTVQGSNIDIDTSNGVRTDHANVLMTDIVASNGVIHVIDDVMMPNCPELIGMA